MIAVICMMAKVPAEAINRKFSIVTSEGRPGVAVNGVPAASFTKRLSTPDGRERMPEAIWVDMKKIIIKSAAGAPLGWQPTVRDV